MTLSARLVPPARPAAWLARPWLVAGALAALLLVSACGRDSQGPASPLTDPVVAATVNGKPILIDDVLAEAVARGAAKEGEDLDPDSALFQQILEDLIETRLFAVEAEARGLDKDPEVRHRLEIARERILANVLNENIADTALKNSAIERMYREQVRLLKQGREVRARHILFDSREAALAAKRRLDQGELFERLAYDLSKDRATAPDGGDIGYFLPEAMPDGFREAAQNTPVGAVSAPVRTEQGWHLVKIEERREAAPPSLESLRPKIVQWLMFEEQRRVVEKLKDSARIARISDSPEGGAATPRAAGPGLPTPDDTPDAPAADAQSPAPEDERPAAPEAAPPAPKPPPPQIAAAPNQIAAAPKPAAPKPAAPNAAAAAEAKPAPAKPGAASSALLAKPAPAKPTPDTTARAGASNDSGLFAPSASAPAAPAARNPASPAPAVPAARLPGERDT